MTPLTLDALAITQWQACRRRATLSRDWLPARWRPKTLFDHCLRRAVASLSSLAPPSAADAAATARATFYARAARPGLDLPGDQVYPAAKEWSALLDVIVRAVARLSLLVVYPLPDRRLPAYPWAWRFLALGRDETGTLHRWITVERWDDAAFTREVHGWPVIGDIALAASPLQLHVVVLGPMRDGHHHVAWGRRFRHPAMPALAPRFRSPNGKPLRGWDAEFLADLAGPAASPDDWVDQVWREGAAARLLHHPIIDCPSEAAITDIRRQIDVEAAEMRRAEGARWDGFAMSRGACDWIGGRCAYQAVCHREGTAIDVDVARLGYVARPGSVTTNGNRPLIRATT